jgi:hypothetical protein
MLSMVNISWAKVSAGPVVQVVECPIWLLEVQATSVFKLLVWRWPKSQWQAS